MPTTGVPPTGMPVNWRIGRVARVSADDAEVWLFGGAGPVRLAGRHAGPLARAVDGTRTLADVIAAAGSAGMDSADAERLALRWFEAGHLVEVTQDGTDERVPAPRVRVVDRTGRSRFRQVLSAAGLAVEDSPEPNDAVLSVLVVDDLVEVASEQVPDATRPMIAVQLAGERALVSPLLGRGLACPDCLAARIRTRRLPEFVAAARVGLVVPPAPSIHRDAADSLAAGVVVATAHACAAAEPVPHPLASAVTVIDPRSAQVERHELVPLPGCATCDPDGPVVNATHLDGPLAVVQESAAADGGGLRARDPDETWAAYAHLISDVVGIVPYVRPTGRPELRAFTAGPNVAAVDDPVLLRSRLRSGAGGKGVTISAARTGALAEALERTSLRARGGEPCRRGRMADIPNAWHPNDLQLFSEEQLRRAEVLRALEIDDPAASGHHRVPAPFDVEAEHDWSPVADLSTGETHWLPSSLVWFDWPGLPAHYPSGSSNGAAAGNTVHEALLQGLLERVERDSVALWWHPRCRRPAFDLQAWDDPRIAAALAPQHALGTDVWVLDVTSDLGIPAAAAVAVGVDALPQVPLMGYGAHVDPVIAVVRALTELAQMQAPLTMAAGEVPLDGLGPHELAWFAEVTVESEPWLAPHGVVSPPDAPDHRDIGEALDDVRDRVTARGYSVLWADCTRPDVGLPVVRTWVPGLRHFWNRYAAGRLYDVPPVLGWCTPGYTEADLNPRPMIL